MSFPAIKITKTTPGGSLEPVATSTPGNADAESPDSNPPGSSGGRKDS